MYRSTDGFAMFIVHTMHSWLGGQWAKVDPVSHSINSPGDICCTFWVGYDPYFPQKKIGWRWCRKFAQNYSKCTKKVKGVSFGADLL